MDQFKYYTINELKQYARQNNIDIRGLTLKSDLLHAILNTGSISVRPSRPVTTSNNQVQTDNALMQMIKANPDMLYELTQRLTLEEIRNLCTTNKEYQAICQSDRFRQLIRQRAEESENRFFDQLYNLVRNQRTFFYTIDNFDHYISYNDGKLEERYHRNPSILAELFEKRKIPFSPIGMKSYKIESPTAEQIKETLKTIINRPDFDMNKFIIGYAPKSSDYRKLCENSSEYRDLCQSRFFQEFITNMERNELKYK